MSSPDDRTVIHGIPVPNELLEDGDWVPGIMAYLLAQWERPRPQFTGILEYLKDQQ